MRLDSGRLILRTTDSNDKTKIFAYRSDKETNKYQGWIPETIEDVETFIGKIAKLINVPGSWFQFSIIEKESQKL